MKWQTSCPEWLMAYGTAEKSAAMNHVPVAAAKNIRNAVEGDTIALNRGGTDGKPESAACDP